MTAEDCKRLEERIDKAISGQRWMVGILITVFLAVFGLGMTWVSDSIATVSEDFGQHEKKAYHDGMPVYVGEVKDNMVQADTELRERHHDDYNRQMESISEMKALLRVLEERSRKWEQE